MPDEPIQPLAFRQETSITSVVRLRHQSLTVDGATNATPIVLSFNAAHGLSDGDIVEVSGVSGNTAANGRWSVVVVDSDDVQLVGSVGNGAYTSGGVASAVPGDATFAIVQAVGGAARWRPDGTDPTTSVGHLLADGNDIRLEGSLLDYKFIRNGSDTPTLEVSFYR